MIQACLFDLDGVIVDTAKYHYLSWQRLAKELNIDSFDEHHNEQLKGISRADSLNYLLKLENKTLSQQDFEQYMQRKNDWFLEYVAQMNADEALTGVEDFLKDIQKQNIRIALGSASKNAKLILDKVGLTHYFEVLIDGNAVTNAKPNPEVFLKGAKALGIAPQNCIVFEDGLAGVQAAQNAKMKVVGIGSTEVLGTADAVIPNFEQITVQKMKELLA